MSQQNVEIYRQAWDAFNRRDLAAWLTVCDPELENIPPRDWPESRPIRGAEAVWDFSVGNMGIFDENPLEILELIEAGDDKVVAQLRSEVQGKASGAPVTWGYWHVVTIRDRRASRFEWFTERAQALEAAGLSE